MHAILEDSLQIKEKIAVFSQNIVTDVFACLSKGKKY